MKDVVNNAKIAKKMSYSQPITEIFEVRTENIMFSVSTNKGGGGGGIMHAPARNSNTEPY